MSNIKNYLEMSAMHQAMQHEKLWEQAFPLKSLSLIIGKPLD